MRRCGRSWAARPSGLLELDERAAEVFRMQEEHRLAMRPDLRLAAAENAPPRRDEPVAGGANVVDLVADVVDAALRAALEEARDRRALAEGLEELDLGIRKRDEDHGDAVLGLGQRRREARAEHVAIDAARGLKIAHRDGDMVE